MAPPIYQASVPIAVVDADASPPAPQLQTPVSSTREAPASSNLSVSDDQINEIEEVTLTPIKDVDRRRQIGSTMEPLASPSTPKPGTLSLHSQSSVSVIELPKAPPWDIRPKKPAPAKPVVSKKPAPKSAAHPKPKKKIMTIIIPARRRGAESALSSPLTPLSSSESEKESDYDDRRDIRSQPGVETTGTQSESPPHPFLNALQEKRRASSPMDSPEQKRRKSVGMVNIGAESSQVRLKPTVAER